MLRRVAALLLLVVVAAGVAGGEPTRPMTLEQWREVEAEIKSTPKLSAVEKVAKLRKAAAGVRIEARAKIYRVIREADAVVLQFCGIHGGFDVPDPVVFEGAAAAVVADWARWDRVSWLQKVVVHEPLGTVEFQDLISDPASLDRKPNPGIETPPLERPVARRSEYAVWIMEFARASARDRPRTANALLRKASKRAYALEATVESVDIEAWEATVRVSTAKLSVTYKPRPHLHRRTELTHYGLREKVHTVAVRDPQALETLKAKDEVDVVVWVEDPGEEGTELHQRVRFWKPR